MKSRWLSSFTVIGILLVILGIAGFILGHRFVFDPGQASDGREPFFYLIIGIVMIINGLLTPPALDEEDETEASPAESGAANPRATGGRDVMTAAEKSTGDA